MRQSQQNSSPGGDIPSASSTSSQEPSLVIYYKCAHMAQVHCALRLADRHTVPCSLSAGAVVFSTSWALGGGTAKRTVRALAAPPQLPLHSKWLYSGRAAEEGELAAYGLGWRVRFAWISRRRVALGGGTAKRTVRALAAPPQLPLHSKWLYSGWAAEEGELVAYGLGWRVRFAWISRRRVALGGGTAKRTVRALAAPP